jgi:hypothetical protein
VEKIVIKEKIGLLGKQVGEKTPTTSKRHEVSL